MSIREWMNSHAALASGGAIAFLAVALGVVVFQLRSPAAPDGAVYFWDVDNDEPFVVSTAQPPIDAPSGGDGVRARLYSCGACAPDEWFGYLWTYSEDYRRILEGGAEQLEQMDPAVAGMVEQRGHLIRPLEGGDWVPHGSPAGQAIRDHVRTRCTPAQPQACLP